MAEQYWVGDFYIDLTRNQITQKMESKTIPPKALAVLTCLAKNANKVVSHDELLSEVWPDTVVTPNTLQRSIAQLRKALGEDSQSYIKTHAKQGYSLEVEVRWQDNIDANALISQEQSTSIEPVPSPTESSSGETLEEKTISLPFLLFVITSFVVLGYIGLSSFTKSTSPKLSISELRSLTATDNKEFAGIYSPDGEYIIFSRYSEKTCLHSNIWAKNIETQKETQLTDNMGVYGNHSFSKDGKRLVFIETKNCENPVVQKECYTLNTLDFEKALSTPQSPSVLMECKNSRIRNPAWLNNDDIAYAQNTSNRWKLASYSIAENKSSVIHSIEEGSVIDYDYSRADDIIALTSVHADGQNYIEIVTPDGQLLSSYPIQYPAEISNQRNIFPNFTPISDHLIFSTGRQLFTLSYEGQINNISLPLDEPMGSPIFHPDGSRMLAIKGNWDADIAKISLSHITSDLVDLTWFNNNKESIVIERSTVEENNAQYQPNGELIAFKSDRTGDDQVWITSDDGVRQLSHFPIDTYIWGLDWAADGQSLLVNVNNTLVQVNLDSSEKIFSFNHRVNQLFQWDSINNTALVTARIKGVLTFGELDLTTSKFKVINNKTVKWAKKSEDGRIIYTDSMDKFWQPGPAEDQMIAVLEKQGSDKRFIIKNNVIYGVNETFQLWSYDLKSDEFNELGKVPSTIDYITDINESDVIFTIRITAKKEVIELILKD